MKFAIVLIALFGAAFAATTVQQFINDNHVLNYALTLEQFEASLYEAGYGFTDNDYVAAGFPTGTAAAIRFIGMQERTHANQLKYFLGLRGWPTVPPCNNYKFPPIATVTQYLATLAQVEAVGTSAYDGAAGAITDKNVLTIAAGIATVEARHTTLINYIINSGANNSIFPTNFTGGAIFPTNFTTPLSFDAVIGAVAPLLGNDCPSNTTTTSYAGSVTVGSLNTASYRWQYATAFRSAQSDTDDVHFYAGNPTAATNDLAILQYALTLENLEANFYATFSSLYSIPNIQAAGSNVSLATATIINSNIALIGLHEAQHVTFLNSTINTFSSGRVVGNSPCTYNFASTGLVGSSNFTQFLLVASQLENTGVAAYVGAIGYIIDSNAAAAAATIATVEAEHAAYLSNLYLNAAANFTNNPFPNVATPVYVVPNTQDAASKPGNIVTAVSGYLASCPAGNQPIFTSTGGFADFFQDQNQNPLAPFATTAAPSSSSRSTSSTTGHGAVVAASFVMVGAIVAAML